MNYLFRYARTIHRLLVLCVTVAILCMGGTGIVMRYPKLIEAVPFFTLATLRSLHNQLSLIFFIILTLMALTGLVMYFVPMYIRWNAQRGRVSIPPQTK